MSHARPRVLFISPVCTHPPTAGNRRRVLNLLELLESFDCDFRYLWFPQEVGSSDPAAMRERWGERYLEVPIQCPQRPAPLARHIRDAILARTGLEWEHPLGIDTFEHEPLADAIRKVRDEFQPTCVIAMYVFWSWTLNLFPKSVHKLIDTNDVMADRHKRFLQAGMEPEWIFTTRWEERRGLRRADATLAIQEKEAEYFRKLTRRPVVTVGHFAALTPLPEPPGPPSILFIGSGNGINRDGVAWMLEHCWPLIHRHNPSFELQLVGGICSVVPNPPPGVRLRGIVDETADAYAGAHIVVSPLRLGTGLKIKCIEALSFGRPLVATSAAAEGLENGAKKAFLVENSPEMFAKSCISLLESASERARLREGGLAFLSQWNDKYRSAFRSVVEGGRAI